MKHFSLTILVLTLSLLGVAACSSAEPVAPTVPPPPRETSAAELTLPSPSPLARPSATPTGGESETTPVVTVTPTPTEWPKFTETPLPTESAMKDVIVEAVMARDTQGETFEPVGITNEFAPDVAVVHAVISLKDAPEGTRVRTVWTAVDVGDAAPPNTALGQHELIAGGTRNLDFTYKPSDQLPAGTFRVDVYLNDQLERTLTWRVQATAQVFTPTAEVTHAPGACPTLTLTAARPPKFAISLTLAQEATGDEKEPVNPTHVFGAHDTFHAVVRIKDAPADTTVKAVWYAEDVGEAEPCNSTLGDYSYTGEGTGNIAFTLAPADEWPTGAYRVEIYVKDELAFSDRFTVE